MMLGETGQMLQPARLISSEKDWLVVRNVKVTTRMWSPECREGQAGDVLQAQFP